MIIEIDEDLFNQVKKIVKGRNIAIFEQLEQLQPTTSNNSLTDARAIKTQRVKQSIKETLLMLHSQDMKPSKYQIHKRTAIAYVTINKYYDEIFDEVLNER